MTKMGVFEALSFLLVPPPQEYLGKHPGAFVIEDRAPSIYLFVILFPRKDASHESLIYSQAIRRRTGKEKPGSKENVFGLDLQVKQQLQGNSSAKTMLMGWFSCGSIWILIALVIPVLARQRYYSGPLECIGGFDTKEGHLRRDKRICKCSSSNPDLKVQLGLNYEDDPSSVLFVEKILCWEEHRHHRHQPGRTNSLASGKVMRRWTGYRHLDLSGIKLQSINLTFFRQLNKNLTEIRLDHNELTMLDWHWFAELNELTNLSCKRNKMTDWTVLRSQKTGGRNSLPLRRIDIGFNKFTKLTVRMTEYLTSVEYFNAESNRIEFIEDRAFSLMENLTTLILRNNRLQTPHMEWFKHATNAGFYAQIYGNPWECNKDIIPYAIASSEDRIQHNGSQPKLPLVACFSPESFRGVVIDAATIERFLVDLRSSVTDDEKQNRIEPVTGHIILELPSYVVLIVVLIFFVLLCFYVFFFCPFRMLRWCKKKMKERPGDPYCSRTDLLAPNGKTPNSSSKTSALKRLGRSWEYLKRRRHSADDGRSDDEKIFAPDDGSAKNSEDQTRISNCSRDFCDVRSRPETTASAVTPGSVYQVPKLRFDYNLPTSPRDQSKNDLGMDGVWTPDASPSCSLLLSDGEVLEGEPNREHLCNDIIAPQAQLSHITCASHTGILIDAEEDQAQSTVDGDLDMVPLLSRTVSSSDITIPISHSDPASSSDSKVYDGKGDGDVSSESLITLLPPCQNFDDTPTTADFAEHDAQQGIDHYEHDESELEFEKETPKCWQNLNVTQSEQSTGSSHLLPPSDGLVFSPRACDPNFPLNGSDASLISNFSTASYSSANSASNCNDSGVAESSESSPEEQDSSAEASEES